MTGFSPLAVVGRVRFGPTRSTPGLEIHLFGELKGVFDLDPKVAHCALQLAVPKKQLAGAEVAGLLVNERDLGSP
jgi:hypothetical protein